MSLKQSPFLYRACGGFLCKEPNTPDAHTAVHSSLPRLQSTMGFVFSSVLAAFWSLALLFYHLKTTTEYSFSYHSISVTTVLAVRLCSFSKWS